MKKNNIYGKDKDSQRVVRQAYKFTYWISLAYLIFMFCLTVYMKLPIYAPATYVLVTVVGSIIYWIKKIPKKVYEYWFTFSSAWLCAVFSIASGTFTIPLLIFMCTLVLSSMYRNEMLILIDTILGVLFSIACYIINFESIFLEGTITAQAQLLLIPACIILMYFSLTSLIKRDKQLFLFAEQKNKNNLALLQVVEAKRDEAEEASRVKTEFLANTSHEIRTPMNSIMGMTELALREDVSPEVRNYLCNIRDAGTNLLNIINDILDFSKIESGKTELSNTDYNILSIMNDICNIISIRIDNNAIQLVTCIDPDVPALMSGDERRIKQILLNLATNAIKYTRRGCITISVSAKPIDENTVMLCCDVRDTGIGIKETDMKKLFSAFERVDTKRNRNIEGTGLGLAICKSLAEIMGGSIKVRSIYGEGSIFGFEIPQTVKDKTSCIRIENREKRNILLCVSKHEQLSAISAELSSLNLKFLAAQKFSSVSKNEVDRFTDILIDYNEYMANKSAVTQASGNITVIADPGVTVPSGEVSVKSIYRPVTVISLLSLFSSEDIPNKNRRTAQLKRFEAPDAKILVVDDNSTNLLVAKRLISLYKPEIDTAESGIQALTMVQKKDYDIVFMDHMMPELDGIETTQAIRSLGGKYAKLTIIALTANVVSGAAELFRESGMNDFLGKPIEMSELNRVMTRYIPADKQLGQTKPEEASEKQSGDDFLKQLEAINGLDIKVALSQCNNNEVLFADILHSAASTATLPRLIEAFEKQDIRTYTIYAHGIRSALHNVGMDSLGKKAYELEMAGKRGDAEFINAHHEEFISGYNSFSKAALKITANRKNPRKGGSIDELKKRLADLIDASADMDYSRARRIIAPLSKNFYGEKIDNKIRTISDAVDSFEFDKVRLIADEVIKGI